MRFSKSTSYSIIAGILVAGLLLSYILSQRVENEILMGALSETEVQSTLIKELAQKSVNTAANDLRAIQAFFNVSENINGREFNEFTSNLLTPNKSYIQALSWVPKISDTQLKVFENNIVTEYPDFVITERNADNGIVKRTKQSTYYPVAYIAPYNLNRVAQGFDLKSNDTRWRSLTVARDTGALTATNKITLVQESASSYGFLIFAPVYKKGYPVRNAKEREIALQGFVSGVFRVDGLFEKAIALADDFSLSIALFESKSIGAEQLFGDDFNRDSKRIFVHSLNLPQRKWQLFIDYSRKYQAYSITLAHWVLLGGWFVSALLAFSAYAFMRTKNSSTQVLTNNRQLSEWNEKLETIVSERTKDLKLKNQALEDNVAELNAKRQTLNNLVEKANSANTEIEKKATELARSNSELDEFAYIASHDLKSPLRGIDQLASWVIEDIDDGNMEDVSENLGLIRQRVQRLESLLNDLLTYSRVGKEKEKRLEVDSNKLCKELFELYAPSADFTLELTSELPKFTTLIAPFEQVLRNLINNAIKHHDNDKGIISITCREVDEHYEFAVTDDGPGISVDYHEQIFVMFKSLKSRDEVEGSGMGLALIKKIVEFNGGKVSLKSEVGAGSTFYFTWLK